jgi:predicted anti-sigma-YlaC factor YlaD
MTHPDESHIARFGAHPEVLDQLCETLGEDTGSPACDALRAHLEKCPGCRAYVDSLMKTIGLYRVADDARAPDHLKDRLYRAMSLPSSDFE